MPHQRLQQGVGAAAQARCRRTERSPPSERHSQLLARQRPLGHGFPDRFPERRPVARRQPVGLLPARQLPLAARRTESQVGTALLWRQQVGRTTEGVALEDLAGVQRAGDIAEPGASAAEANRELGRSLGIGRNSTEPADHIADRACADRIKQMPSQPPRQCLTPSQRHQRRLIAPASPERKAAPMTETSPAVESPSTANPAHSPTRERPPGLGQCCSYVNSGSFLRVLKTTRASFRLRQRIASRSALAFGLFAFEVGARRRMDARLGDRDPVECAVELAVAATVEAVALHAS